MTKIRTLALLAPLFLGTLLFGQITHSGGGTGSGTQGPAGPAGLTWQGAWSSSTAYSLRDAVSFNGSSYVAITGGTNHQPDTSPTFWSLLASKGADGSAGATGSAGADGATGAAGAAATVSVGTVTTLTAGSSATVTNAGSSSAAVFNFGIPRGADGSGTGSGLTTGLLSARGACDQAGKQYLATDNPLGQQLFTCSGVGGTWVQDAAPGENLSLMNTSEGKLEADPAVLAFLQPPGGTNTWHGIQDFTGATVTGISGTGSSFYQTLQVGGSAQTQRAKLNVVAGTGVTVTPTDNGTDTTTLTVASTGGTAVAADGPYLKVGTTDYLASHMIAVTPFDATPFDVFVGASRVFTAASTGTPATLSGTDTIDMMTAPAPTDGVFHIAATCTLQLNGACGVVAADGDGTSGIQLVCQVYNDTNEAATQHQSVLCIRYVNGAQDSIPGGMYSVPVSWGDIWMGFEVNRTTLRTSFVMSGDGRTWYEMIGWEHFNIWGNYPTRFGIATRWGAKMTILHEDSH